MKLGEVILTYNSDDANMQTIIVNSHHINICSNKTMHNYTWMKPAILGTNLIVILHWRNTGGREGEEEVG